MTVIAARDRTPSRHGKDAIRRSDAGGPAASDPTAGLEPPTVPVTAPSVPAPRERPDRLPECGEPLRDVERDSVRYEFRFRDELWDNNDFGDRVVISECYCYGSVLCFVDG